jgi:hypothetical protein
MRKPLTVLLTASLLLSACGGWSTSRVNPTNWFGNSSSIPVPPSEGTPAAVNPLIPANADRKGLFARPDKADKSVPIQSISALSVEPTTTGAILRVTGLASRQGAYNTGLRLDLSEENTANGTLSYTFRVVYPDEPTPQGSELTRTITEAVSLSNKDLEGVKLIRVVGELNIRETRRR